MDFSIVSDTANDNVSELADELMEKLEDNINKIFNNNSVSIGFAIRCLPNSYNRNSFIRYTIKDNYLTIDFNVSMEEYEKMYKIEQRFNLGNEFLQWLRKGLENKNFSKNNPDFDKEIFIKTVVDLGKEIGWFADEIDWTVDLDK
jgi:hypothetical protein